MIYFNKIKTIEETVKHIQTVSSKDIRDLSNEIFENGALNKSNFIFEKSIASESRLRKVICQH